MKALCLALGSAVALTGCGVPDIATQNRSPVIFKIVDINGGVPFQSDVALGSGATAVVTADAIPVTLAVRPKNPTFDNVPQVAMAVFVERYTVRFYRSDGRNVEGVDVPVAVGGDVRTAIDVSLDGSTNLTLGVEVVRAAAKLEPPLRNLRSGGATGGGFLRLTCFAQITIYGRTTAGQAVSDTAPVEISFADF